MQKIKSGYVLIHKNYGEASAALLEHSHSHLLATPITPRRVKTELDYAKDYYESNVQKEIASVESKFRKLGLKMLMLNTKNPGASTWRGFYLYARIIFVFVFIYGYRKRK